MTSRTRFPRFRRFVLRTRRDLRAGGRIAATGLAAGLGTYAGLRVGGKIMRPLGRIRTLERISPSLAGELRGVGTHANALNWGVGTGVLALGSKAHDELKRGLRRRYRRWLHTGH